MDELLPAPGSFGCGLFSCPAGVELVAGFPLDVELRYAVKMTNNIFYRYNRLSYVRKILI